MHRNHNVFLPPFSLRHNLNIFNLYLISSLSGLILLLVRFCLYLLKDDQIKDGCIYYSTVYQLAFAPQHTGRYDGEFHYSASLNTLSIFIALKAKQQANSHPLRSNFMLLSIDHSDIMATMTEVSVCCWFSDP